MSFCAFNARHTNSGPKLNRPLYVPDEWAITFKQAGVDRECFVNFEDLSDMIEWACDRADESTVTVRPLPR